MRRIAIDLDGTICEIRRDGQSYADVQPLAGAADRLRDLRRAGYCIVIVTARNMGTCEGNIGRVMKNVGLITLTWLERHGIEYDELHFGKPNADLYIDDRAFRFASWSEISADVIEREAKDR